MQAIRRQAWVCTEQAPLAASHLQEVVQEEKRRMEERKKLRE